ncbi:autophagy-related protein 101, partial [Quercus suber]
IQSDWISLHLKFQKTVRSELFLSSRQNFTHEYLLGFFENLQSFNFSLIRDYSTTMNCEVCQLKDLEVEHFEIREVLRCILHTIVFHRALGLVRPKDVDLELFDVTYRVYIKWVQRAAEPSNSSK